MLGKFAASQALGIPAGYIAYEICSRAISNVPFYIPLLGWLLTSLYVIAKL